MAFIRKKIRTNRRQTYFSLVENVRDGNTVKQRVILYLGPCDSIEKAIAYFRDEARKQIERSQGWVWISRPWGQPSIYQKQPLPTLPKKPTKPHGDGSYWLMRLEEELTRYQRSVNALRWEKDRRKRAKNLSKKYERAAQKCERYLRNYSVVPNCGEDSSAQLGTTKIGLPDKLSGPDSLSVTPQIP